MVSLLVNAFAVLVFLFLFWKRLKEDYASQVIFTSAFYILIGLFAGIGLSKQFFPAWYFWGSLLGAAFGLGLSVARYKVRAYEVAEAGIFSLLPMLLLFFLNDSVKNSSLVSFIAFLVVLLVIFIFTFLDSRYREFTWYKSGKIGFSGLAALGILFLVRSGVAIFFTDVLSFVGKSEVFVSGALAFICFMMIFNLGRQE